MPSRTLMPKMLQSEKLTLASIWAGCSSLLATSYFRVRHVIFKSKINGTLLPSSQTLVRLR